MSCYQRASDHHFYLLGAIARLHLTSFWWPRLPELKVAAGFKLLELSNYIFATDACILSAIIEGHHKSQLDSLVST